MQDVIETSLKNATSPPVPVWRSPTTFTVEIENPGAYRSQAINYQAQTTVLVTEYVVAPDINSLGHIVLTRNDIVHLLTIARWNALHITPRIREREKAETVIPTIDQAVVLAFAALPNVAQIYADRYRAEHIFNIFITDERYDDEGMDQLLAREFKLLNEFEPLQLVFRYLPRVAGQASRKMVRDSARLIFQAS